MNARQKRKKLKKKKMYNIDQLNSSSVHPEILKFELKREVLDKASDYICISKCEDEYPGAYTYEWHRVQSGVRDSY